MKRFIGLMLAVALLCGAMALASAEQPAPYQMGDKMEDFSATLSDGTGVSLYGLLAEKKAVLINFWASWCGPCKREFPAMQQAYDEMSDEIGIIALSCEPSDTDEVVLALKEELGLGSLPMGLDASNLANRFKLTGYPTSVIVDRNGVICFIEAGSIPDKDKFIRLFSTYTADDYSEPVLLNEIPRAKPTVEYPSVEALSAALNISGDAIALTMPDDGFIWPFIPAQDNSYAQAANGGAKDSNAKLTLNVTAKAGEGLAYEYDVTCPVGYDGVMVSVEGETVRYYAGDTGWRSDYVTFPADGTYAVDIRFERGLSDTEQAEAMLRNVRVLSADEVAKLEAETPAAPKTLSGTECEIVPVSADEYKEIVMPRLSDDWKASLGTLIIAQGDSLALRVKIGADVNEHLAIMTDDAHALMLTELPCDDEGYLYETPVVSGAAGNTFRAFTSVLNTAEGLSNRITCLASEADADAYANMFAAQLASRGYTAADFIWEYADGSPKSDAAAAAEPEEAPLADGTAKYVITVTDETGAPVVGAMVQICDDATCQVAVTDGEGVVTHTGPAYPYEIHLLKAPDGYAPDAETYTFPEMGGELSIVLKKQ